MNSREDEPRTAHDPIDHCAEFGKTSVESRIVHRREAAIRTAAIRARIRLLKVHT
jgi:hypothetical protein